MDDSQFLAAFREFPDRIRVIEWKDGRNHMRLDCHDQGPWYVIGQRMPKIRWRGWLNRSVMSRV